MNKLRTYIKICAAAIMAFSSLTACQEEELQKPHALLSDPSLTFEAKGAEPQLLTIASDEDWIIDAPEWITVDPMSGSQTMEVTVSVTDNVDANGAEALPRQGVITIASTRDGYSIETNIFQKGDNYVGVEEMSLADFVKLEDEAFAKITEAQVVGLASDGFVATDAAVSVYVKSDQEVSLGDKVYMAGQKVTLYGIASLNAGEVRVLSNGEPAWPSPVDLLANLDPSKAGAVIYVSVTAGILGRDLQFEEQLPVTVTLLDPKAGTLDLDAVNMHNISIKGYFIGLDKTNAKLVVTELEDLGMNDNLKAYFYDDFSWMKPFIEASGVKVGDSIGENNASADAPNLRNTANLASLLNELLARGYQDLNPDAKVIYPQKYYWKFGKTDNHNGIILPALEFKGSELINAVLNFDWAAHMTGSGNIDKVQIVVELEGSGLFENGTNISDPFITTQEKGHIEWQHASVLMKGVNKNTKITIRPLNYAEKVPDQQRWHLDNIKIVDSDIPYSDPVYAKLTVSDEIVTFEGTPTDPAELKITSDNNWTLTKSIDSNWFDIDVTEGKAGEETTVTVTCQPSTSSTLRHGYITIASADTRKNIYVVQSAAGGELDPLISVVGGNYVTVLGEGDSFSAKVQSNVEYEIETSEWIEVVETPASKAIVETKEHFFKALPNMTGSDRTGFVRFRKGQLEAVLNVTQENFEPRITLNAPAGTYLGISGLGAKLSYGIDANIPFEVTADASWIKLPASSGDKGVYDIPVTFEANTGNRRTGKVTFTNSEYGYVFTAEITQFAAGVLFDDDFSWLAPIVKAYNPDGSKNLDTVGKHDLKADAPNIYTTAALKDAFVPLRDKIGYIIPGKDDKANNVLYLQDCYLKMGKTSSSSQTSLTIPAFDPAGKSFDISFDWARMEQGDGTIDNYTLTLMITGNGTFENGTKYSDELSTPQKKGEMFWTDFSVKVSGADKDTRITFVATDLLDKSTGKIDYTKKGGRRMFIDNIVVKAN